MRASCPARGHGAGCLKASSRKRPRSIDSHAVRAPPSREAAQERGALRRCNGHRRKSSAAAAAERIRRQLKVSGQKQRAKEFNFYIPILCRANCSSLCAVATAWSTSAMRGCTARRSWFAHRAASSRWRHGRNSTNGARPSPPTSMKSAERPSAMGCMRPPRMPEKSANRALALKTSRRMAYPAPLPRRIPPWHYAEPLTTVSPSNLFPRPRGIILAAAQPP